MKYKIAPWNSPHKIARTAVRILSLLTAKVTIPREDLTLVEG